MPNFGDYIIYGDISNTGTSTSTSSSIWGSNVPLEVTIPYYAQQQYEEYQRECERQDRAYEIQTQMWEEEMKEEKQLIEDKKRYPLFFLKEGIV